MANAAYLSTRSEAPTVEQREAVGVETISGRTAIRRFLETGAQHHLSCLLLNPGAEIFTVNETEGVGFVRHGSRAICIGGVMAAPDNVAHIGGRFLDWSAKAGLKPFFLHFPEAQKSFLEGAGFQVNQLGASYTLKFENFTPTGKAFQQVRRKRNNAERAGVTIEEIETKGAFDTVLPDLVRINRSWQLEKNAKPLRYLVADFDALSIPDTENRLFVARHDGVVISYLVFTRTYGADAGWFHNLSRRIAGCVDGTMQLITLNFLSSEGTGRMHFGFTPLVEMQASAGGSRVFSWIAYELARRGGVVYPAAAQRQYKRSWNPGTIMNEFFAYREGPLPAVASLLRATRSI